MFSVGISIYRALKLLRGQTGNPDLQSAIVGIENAVRGGSSLSDGVSRYPKVFSQHIRTTMEMAESSGSLPLILEEIANHEEAAYRTELNIRKALVYPVWIMVVVVVFVFWVPPFLFGELFAMLERSDVELPLISKVMLGFSQLAGHPLFYIFTIAVLASVIFAVRRILSTPAMRFDLYRNLHRIPVLRGNLTALASCRFARSFGMMIDAGVPVIKALEQATLATDDPVLSDRLGTARAALVDGATVADAIDRMEYFPSLFVTTLEVGQESGQIGPILKRVVTLYEVELEYRSELLLATLEPLAMMVMGLFVGASIAATMIPLMRLVQTL